MCVFCKIINGEIPSKRVYEDENMIIINDLNPQADKHYLMIPKEHFASVCEMSESQALILGKCLYKVGKMANELGLSEGFRLVSNKGENGCQSVPHLHVHILGGNKLADKMC